MCNPVNDTKNNRRGREREKEKSEFYVFGIGLIDMKNSLSSFIFPILFEFDIHDMQPKDKENQSHDHGKSNIPT